MSEVEYIYQFGLFIQPKQQDPFSYIERVGGHSVIVQFYIDFAEWVDHLTKEIPRIILT